MPAQKFKYPAGFLCAGQYDTPPLIYKRSPQDGTAYQLYPPDDSIHALETIACYIPDTYISGIFLELAARQSEGDTKSRLIIRPSTEWRIAAMKLQDPPLQLCLYLDDMIMGRSGRSFRNRDRSEHQSHLAELTQHPKKGSRPLATFLPTDATPVIEKAIRTHNRQATDLYYRSLQVKILPPIETVFATMAEVIHAGRGLRKKGPDSGLHL
jgi:hypothetical protein